MNYINSIMKKKMRMGNKVMSRKLERKEARLVKQVRKGNAKKGPSLSVGVGKVVLMDGTTAHRWSLSVRVNPARPEKVWVEHEMSNKAGHWMHPLLVVSVAKRNGARVKLWQWKKDLPSKKVDKINAVWKVGTPEETHGWANSPAWKKKEAKEKENK